MIKQKLIMKQMLFLERCSDLQLYLLLLFINFMNLQELCDLWKYQHTESRFTGFLKEQIEGYDNGKVYNIEQAKKDRNQWLQEIKFHKQQKDDLLDQVKEEYLDRLLHPEKIYLRPKKAEYEVEREPYGKNDPLLKGYENAAKHNLKPNIVNFKLYLEYELKKQKEEKKHLDYVKTFYEKFGQVLVKKSPEFWKTLLYEIFEKIAKSKDKSDDYLYNQLNIILTDEATAIKYLITFRKELCEFLDSSNFFQKSIDQLKLDDQSAPEQKSNKKIEKQKLNKWLTNNEENLDEINFLKMNNQDLIQKIPTLKRFDHTEYIQFRLDPLPKLVSNETERIKVSDFVDQTYRKCFQSEYLNPIQSKVFEHAFNCSDNMLVCAPTGSGKTNIATLSILQAIKSVGYPENVRIVYISPMKALANELVQKFGVKLPFLKTRQSTGDIQLSQKQMATTNILITTPEKFDVTTRKGTSALETIHLIILDQVHLLNDERGWVLESIVARLFRTVERTQRHIRLVGLSATLPNYFDVADFLKVDRQKGLFHFDSTHRPVPLLINFIGVKNPKDHTNNLSKKRNIRDIYNEKCYEIAISHLKNDKQVLIFVHSRRETMRFCEYVVERSKVMKDEHILKQVGGISKKYPNLRDVNLRKLVNDNVAFHHAGMVRSDRDSVEKMFERGQVKILLATATLAWGVNLPAYAVIIKGTDIYDPNQAESKDLSILDVQQMFGRAGRPQYDTFGEATLMSDHSKVNHYMGALTNSTAIDSRFLKFIKEALNAEVTSGTVTSEDQAFEWLKYTFLAVRLKRCPEVYGCPRGANEVQKQLNFDQFLRERIIQVLKQLDQMKLIRLDHKNGTVNSTEIGRITSHYYIKCETMSHFCHTLNIYSLDDPGKMKNRFDYKTDLQLLNILSQCKEFQSISPRPQEMDELKELTRYWILDEEPDFIMKKDRTSVNLDDGPMIDTPQKVILLLQGYLRDVTFSNFSLINDTQYVVQNSIRLLRCMLDLCSKKNQANNVRIILDWCKFIENRVYKDDSPLKQFTRFSYTGFNAMRMKKQMDGFLSHGNYERFMEANVSTDQYLDQSDNTDRMALLNMKTNNHIVSELRQFCSYVPKVDVEYSVKPIAQTILKIDVIITPAWNFNPKWHLKSEIFWVLFDNEEQLLHSQTIAIEEQFVTKHRGVKTSFYVRYKGKTEETYRLSVLSDRWMTDDNSDTIISLEKLGIQLDTMPFTELLDIQPLPVTALKNPVFESLYKYFKFFNPIQTQIFFSLYQTNKNILIGAPTGSGKTIMSELAILNLMKTNPDKKVVYIAPLKSLVRERLKDWTHRFNKIKKSVVQLSGDFTPDIQSLNKADIIVTTPQKWDGITRSKQRQYTKKVGLVIFDEIHLLGQERGAVLEVIVSRMNKESKVRMVGLSTAMANGSDVAEWFGTDSYGFFNFRPSVRPVPIEIHFEGFSEKHYCPRMATMNKPAYNHIKKFSDGKPVIIFVSSRRQTRLTANDLIAYSQMDNKDKCPFVMCSQNIIQQAIQKIHDEYLKQTLSFGIVMHHAGLDNHDRQICQELFVNNKVQIMVATSTLAWGVNFPARLVIIKGTQFFDAKSHKYVDFQATDLLQMIGRAGRPQYDDKGVAVVYCENSKKNFYRKFLNDPFPIESSLIQQIEDHVNAEITRGQINNSQDCIEWITWSFMFRRVLKNPNYYGLQGSSNEKIKEFLKQTVAKIFKSLHSSKCIEVFKSEDGETYVSPTQMGFIASSYYLKHQTVSKFNQEIKAGLQFKDLLKIISDADEFKETPLRHNEDVHNRELSDIAPFKAKNFASPQDKTFLLLQMHFFNLPFPIRDYVNDCKLILDSCSRVIMGLIEMAKQKKYLDVVMNAIYIQQSIYQGMSCNIPYITHDVWEKMSKQFYGLAGLVEKFNENYHAFDKIETFLKKHVIEYDAYKKQKIVHALKSYPQIKMVSKTKKFDSENNIEKDLPGEDGGQAIIYIDILKQNQCSNRVIAQKHTKIKDVTWWVLIGDSKNNLLGMKKVSVKKKVTLKLQIDVPENTSKNKVEIYLMADSYVGLDQVQTLKFEAEKEK